MAGLTPFQFSSGKRQYDVTSLYKTVTPSILSDSAADLLAWYEMWINPSIVKKDTTYKQNRQHTAGSIVTYFYRPDITVLSASGKCGWVRIKSMIEELKADTMAGILTRDMSGTKEDLKEMQDSLSSMKLPWNMTSGHSNRFNNSPLEFLKRLKNLANEPMYYIDADGVEHFNPKYIKVFTKEYPDGVIYQGYFDHFTVDENVDYGETIAYEFTFVIQKETPVTLIQRVLGAYAGYGSAIGDGLSLL